MQTVKRMSLCALAVLSITAFANASAASATPGFVSGGHEILFVDGGPAFPSGLFNIAGNDGKKYSAYCKAPVVYQNLSILKTPTLSFTGSGNECTSGEQVGSMIFHECGFTFTPGATAPSYKGTVTTAGPANCQPMTIENIPYAGCKLSVDLHNSYTGTAWFTNAAEGNIRILGLLTELKYTASGSAPCPQGSGKLEWWPYWKVMSFEHAKPTELKVVSEL